MCLQQSLLEDLLSALVAEQGNAFAALAKSVFHCCALVMPVFISRWVRWVRALLLRCANSSLPNCPIAKFSEIPYKNIQNTSWHFSRLRSMSCKPAAHFSGDWRCSFPLGVLLLNRDERSLMQPAMEGGTWCFTTKLRSIIKVLW